MFGKKNKEYFEIEEPDPYTKKETGVYKRNNSGSGLDSSRMYSTKSRTYEKSELEFKVTR